jgi:hypothetical protein
LLQAFAPLWPMSIAGAAVVISLQAEPGAELEEACAAGGIQLERDLASTDVADPSQLARLMREALDAASGRK